MNEPLADLVALRGKRALVTGGGGTIVSRLHQAGAAVWSADLPGRAAPAGARVLEADLADASTADTLAAEEEYRLRALAETALGRLGLPDDVARVVLFLCCALGRHVTGQVVRVDGGQLMA